MNLVIYMKFKKYNNIKDFCEENLELLLEKEWLNNLIVGNCFDALENGGEEDWILANVSNDGKTELIILYRKPWKVLLYTPTDNFSKELYEFAANEMYKIDRNLIGVNTDYRAAELFAKEYTKLSGKEYKILFPMRILLLEKINEGKLLENASLRELNDNDKELAIDWIDKFYKEALNEIHDREKLEEKYENYKERGYYFLEIDGKVVSQAIFARKLKYGKSISYVYTPENQRGKGYAYNCVYLLTKKTMEEGAKYCVLYTDDSNHISNHVYEKIGYKRKSDQLDIAFL